MSRARSWRTGANPAYAQVFGKAGVADADALGRKALKQIAAIQELGKRTDDFAKLVPAARGIPKADRDAVLSMLRARARLLDTEIAPRVRAAMAEARKRAKGLPAFEIAFQKELGKVQFGDALATVKRKIAAGAPRRNLTDPELVAINHYTGAASYGLNHALASGDAGRIKSVDNFKQTLQVALAKLPDEAGTFRRGVSLTEADHARYVVGEVVTEPIFMSTTATAGKVFPGNTRFIVQGKHGKDMVQYSRHPREDERLFTADTQFLVVEREVRDGRLWIKLTEVE